MGYFTIKDEAIAEYEEKKSVFIGHIKRVYTEEEARAFIDKIKSKHKEARHNVYAYVIGENMGIQRYTDDGEPQGTSGIPTLNSIKQNNLTNVAIVVTRYFGGVLLGTGGLVRSYSKAATMAIKEGKVVEKVTGKELYINLDYDLLGKVQYLCNKNLWYIHDTVYTDKVKIKLVCEISEIDNIQKIIIESCSGNCTFEESDEIYYFKIGNKLEEEIS